MYDVGEVDGLPFLTMEYVDGEDLSSLLRRIGRLPEDKALDLARQMCAGLAAAHERGILHRDLKPANVMIDGEGKVRITDFGLAAVAGAAGQSRAGTPAYMAPELLAGKDASVQSDLYALGLVFYELFTGRRAFIAQSIADLVRQQSESQLTTPTSLVRDLDPAIEKTILRTLAREPELRPASALAVAASLPGGDPLAAALAAGETPSPEMVAAAGEQRRVATPYAIAGTLGVIALLIVSALVSVQRRTLSRAGLDKPPEVLLDRAQQVLEKVGQPSRAGNHWSEFTLDGDLLAYSNAHPETWAGGDVFTGRPGVLRFAHRTSPRVLAPLNPLAAVSMDDPPFVVSGMTQVVLDAQGRLLTLHVVPPQKATADGSATPDWSALFALAGPGSIHVPRGGAGVAAAGAVRRAAGVGRGDAGTVAAGSGRGGGLERAADLLSGRGAMDASGSHGGGAGRARRATAECAGGERDDAPDRLSVVRGPVERPRRPRRLDRRLAPGRGGAGRPVARLGVQRSARRQPDPRSDPLLRVDRRVAVRRRAAVRDVSRRRTGGPRRYWPDGLLGWTRLLQGRVLDARVARDILIGLAAGAAMQVVIDLREPMQQLAGVHVPAVSFGNTRYFEGARYVVGFLFSLVGFQAVFSAMWCIFAIVGLKRLFGRTPIVFVLAVIAFTFIEARDLYIGAPGHPWINFTVALTVFAVLASVATRIGLLATSAAFLASFVIAETPWTFDSNAWYFAPSTTALLFLLGLAGFCGYAAQDHQHTSRRDVRRLGDARTSKDLGP